jgi:hypothetical protein
MINKITSIFVYEAFDVRILVGTAGQALLSAPKIHQKNDIHLFKKNYSEVVY